MLRMQLAQAFGDSFNLKSDESLAGGLQQLSQSNFDVLLLDLHVLDSAGFDTFANAKSGAPGVPIVIISGSDDGQHVARAMQEGAAGFLVKAEFTPEELADCIHRAVRQDA